MEMDSALVAGARSCNRKWHVSAAAQAVGKNEKPSSRSGAKDLFSPTHFSRAANFLKSIATLPPRGVLFNLNIYRVDVPVDKK
jgi:hypothetical protein